MTTRQRELPPEFVEALDHARARLGGLASDVRFFPSTGSTNDIAAALAAAGGHEGTVVVADEQTAGRGRRGRTWFSPPASGLYVSVVLVPARAKVTPDRAIGLLTLAAGVALAEAVEHATGLTTDIKWPNDLLIGRRKLAGILAEAVDRRPVPDTRERHGASASASGSLEPLRGTDVASNSGGGGVPDASEMDGAPREIGNVILGYGINVGAMSYPPALAGRATSLETELGRPIDRAMLFAETLASLASRYDDLLAGRFDAILDQWRERGPSSIGARVAWDTPSGRRSGVTAGIDERGALLVQAGGQVERIVSGEIAWL